jgi:hypothetical protein
MFMLEKKAIERELMLLTDKTFVEVPCQIDSPEIPYDGTQPLPPIFGNQMCWKSHAFRLSNSLPNLQMLSWSEPDYDFTDEAEEALAKRTTGQSESTTYEDERDCVRVNRLSKLNSEQVEDPTLYHKKRMLERYIDLLIYE